jgi:phosphatidylinositol 4-kinase
LFGPDTAELGASIAEQFGKAVGPVYRHLSKYICIHIMSMD